MQMYCRFGAHDLDSLDRPSEKAAENSVARAPACCDKPAFQRLPWLIFVFTANPGSPVV